MLSQNHRVRNDFFGYRRYEALAKDIKPSFKKIKVKGHQCLDYTYVYKNNFTSYKQYLFGLFFSEKPKKTCTVQSKLQEKRLKDLQKWQTQNTFAPVCMLLVQLASINGFYLKDIVFLS